MWYFYFILVFELVDCNFNVWWVDQKCLFDCINYGVDFVYINFIGCKDKFKGLVKYGYMCKYVLFYSMFYFNKV